MIKKMFEILCSNFSIGLVQLMPQNIIGFHLMIYINMFFKDTLKAFDDFKIKQKSV